MWNPNGGLIGEGGCATSLQGLLLLQQVELLDNVVDLFLELLNGRVLLSLWF